jgi:hypothetical protein
MQLERLFETYRMFLGVYDCCIFNEMSLGWSPPLSTLIIVSPNVPERNCSRVSHPRYLYLSLELRVLYDHGRESRVGKFDLTGTKKARPFQVVWTYWDLICRQSSKQQALDVPEWPFRTSMLLWRLESEFAKQRLLREYFSRSGTRHLPCESSFATLLNASALLLANSAANGIQHVKISLYRTSLVGNAILLGNITSHLMDFEPRGQGIVLGFCASFNWFSMPATSRGRQDDYNEGWWGNCNDHFKSWRDSLQVSFYLYYSRRCSC